ncbi:hypothetical protein AGR3A_Cc420197 [Agrobacterium tomkonis CFBP 6623]|uniref:Uncharacterized protein n=1 Tax=Agrobacterium tomkonis CFBP 6623 TaxID=1183432 RepID=A0A1S7QBI2_9HYPH|nr:hypothetical protein AGR3A_Cc420197 [Agrobacterium tomkonis CFBP 6623]
MLTHVFRGLLAGDIVGGAPVERAATEIEEATVFDAENVPAVICVDLRAFAILQVTMHECGALCRIGEEIPAGAFKAVLDLKAELPGKRVGVSDLRCGDLRKRPFCFRFKFRPDKQDSRHDARRTGPVDVLVQAHMFPRLTKRFHVKGLTSRADVVTVGVEERLVVREKDTCPVIGEKQICEKIAFHAGRRATKLGKEIIESAEIVIHQCVAADGEHLGVGVDSKGLAFLTDRTVLDGAGLQQLFQFRRFPRTNNGVRAEVTHVALIGQPLQRRGIYFVALQQRAIPCRFQKQREIRRGVLPTRRKASEAAIVANQHVTHALVIHAARGYAALFKITAPDFDGGTAHKGIVLNFGLCAKAHSQRVHDKIVGIIPGTAVAGKGIKTNMAIGGGFLIAVVHKIEICFADGVHRTALADNLVKLFDLHARADSRIAHAEQALSVGNRKTDAAANRRNNRVLVMAGFDLVFQNVIRRVAAGRRGLPSHFHISSNCCVGIGGNGDKGNLCRLPASYGDDRHAIAPGRFFGFQDAVSDAGTMKHAVTDQRESGIAVVVVGEEQLHVKLAILEAGFDNLPQDILHAGAAVAVQHGQVFQAGCHDRLARAEQDFVAEIPANRRFRRRHNPNRAFFLIERFRLETPSAAKAAVSFGFAKGDCHS